VLEIIQSDQYDGNQHSVLYPHQMPPNLTTSV